MTYGTKRIKLALEQVRGDGSHCTTGGPSSCGSMEEEEGNRSLEVQMQVDGGYAGKCLCKFFSDCSYFVIINSAAGEDGRYWNSGEKGDVK